MRRKRTNTLEVKIRRVAKKTWDSYLKSQGDRILTLNPEKYHPGVVITAILQTSFTIGERKIVKQTQRSFSVGKQTKVPAVLADSFLKESPELVEVIGSERKRNDDWPDTIE